MDTFSFAVLVGAFVGLALIFGMVLWNKYWDSLYFVRRRRRFLIGVALTAVLVLMVALPATDEFWFGIEVFVIMAVGVCAGGFFAEAFEPDRFWLNRELRRIATRG